MLDFQVPKGYSAILCPHDIGKRKYYGPGWICEKKNGGCGATGSGDRAHYEPVIGLFKTPGAE